MKRKDNEISRSLVDEIRHLAGLGYTRRGGKDNRRAQLGSMVDFGYHCMRLGAKNWAQVGQRHVVTFSAEKADLAVSTRYEYGLAIGKAFALCKKPAPDLRLFPHPSPAKPAVGEALVAGAKPPARHEVRA